MKSQNNTTYIGLAVLALILIVLVVVAYRQGPKTPSSNTIVATMGTTTTYTNATTGVSFSYPANLSTNYIRAVNWPPAISVTNNPFLCTNAGSVIAAAGKTNLVTIDSTPYCVTVEGEGAAGSIYYQYAYAFQKAGKTMILTFVLQYPQCVNYDEPRATECKNEETGLDVNTFANAIAKSMTYTPPVSSAGSQSSSSRSSEYHF